MTKRASTVDDKANRMPSVLDRELSDNAKDAFGHHQYAEALTDLIESPSNETPFSIGLLGPWGTGKSTIKEFYLRSLATDKSGSPGRRRADRIHAITFNAWRFGGEQDLKRSLLREAFRQLGGDEAALRRELFEQVNRVVRKKRPFLDWAGEAFGQILGSAVLFFLMLLGTLVATFAFIHFSGVTDRYTLSAMIFGSVIAAGWLGKHVVDLRIRTPATYLPQTTISFPSRSAEEYETLLTEQIETFRTHAAASCERLVVFVDDLDRLSAPEMVAGLDAIRTFLELPFSAAKNSFGVVFVISCDEAKIAEALHRGRGPQGSSDLPGSVFSRADARRYLDRLFQFRLEIPMFPKQDMRQFALTRLSEANIVTADLEAMDVPAATVVDRLIHVDVQSPRNAIQLLNAFIQSWWIAKQRERSGAGSSAHGVLHSGAVTNHPLSLAAMCVLRVDFPDFYECVQLRPEFLHEFRSVVFGTEKAVGQALVAQDMLKTFLARGDDELTDNVQPEYRKLRQYLASVQDLRWPTRLQPLLRLAEDPITRRYGDRAATILDALVSGDIQGVLEGFGRDLDTKELSQDDASLLGDLTDTLTLETEARRIAASRVLAGLFDRIPEDRRRLLLTPLVRQMVDLAPVRMNVGPGAARRIGRHSLPQDRREVAERFVSDLLHGNEIHWTNPSGGSPNLDEATTLVRETLDLALEIRGIDGLPDSADSALRSWLLTRHVQVDGQSHTLPFSEFEGLVSEHESHLLPDLGADYSDQAISAFRSDAESVASTGATLARVDKVFQRMADSGQEERAILWSQLTPLVSVPSIEASDAASNAATTHRELADATQARKFLSAFAARLIQQLEDAEASEPDCAERAARFNDLLTHWGDYLDDETAMSIVPLLAAWSLNPEYTHFSVPGLDLLRTQDGPAWHKSMEILLQNDVAAFPPDTCFYVGRHVLSLAEEHTATIIQQLDAIIQRNPPDEGASASYHQYVGAIPRQAWSSSPWRDHLERLFAHAESMYANPSFLEALFPSVIHLFNTAPDGRTAQLITHLFNNAPNVPDAYIVLHTAIAGHWPDTDAQIGDYAPHALAERACLFIEQQPNRADLGNVLASLRDLSERKVASDAMDNRRVASVIPIIWRVAHRSVIENTHYVSKVLEPAHTAELFNGDQPPDLTQQDLATFLGQVVATYDADACFDVLQAILGQQPYTLFDSPDGALSQWLAAAGNMNDVIATRALSDDYFNDEQHRRVAAQVTDEFWVSGDMQSVETVLRRHAAPKTRASVLDRLQDISNQSLSASQKATFSSHLIASLPSLSADDIASVAQAVRKLGGKGALEKAASVVDELDDDQKRTLQSVFPDSRLLASIDAS